MDDSRKGMRDKLEGMMLSFEKEEGTGSSTVLLATALMSVVDELDRIGNVLDEINFRDKSRLQDEGKMVQL